MFHKMYYSAIVVMLALHPGAFVNASDDPSARAILVPGSGTYSRTISTDNAQAQAFFDQGLRLAWGFYFPESIASIREASPSTQPHPMPYWGMAHAMGLTQIPVMHECLMIRRRRT